VSIERNLSDISAFIEACAEPSFTAQYVSQSYAINNTGVLIALPTILLNGLGGVNLLAIFPANTLVFILSLKIATSNELP
ncbi:16893_t:CDS:1, partial [Funneliformis geosporum]